MIPTFQFYLTGYVQYRIYNDNGFPFQVIIMDKFFIYYADMSTLFFDMLVDCPLVLFDFFY